MPAPEPPQPAPVGGTTTPAPASPARPELPTAPERGTAPQSGQQPGVAGNERLTAMAGALVLLLSVLELITVPALRTLTGVHIVVGALLAGPVAVKTASTIWRFLRYYTGSPAYRHKGPPRPLLRALAPLLVISTLSVIGTGIALALTGPAPQTLVRLHVVSFLAWTVALALHLFAYLRPVPRLIAAEGRRTEPVAPPGRAARLGANAAGLAAGAVTAVLLLPSIPAWTRWGVGNGTKYLLVYAVAALLGLATSRTARRRNN